MNRPAPGEPVSTWHAPIRLPDTPRGTDILLLHEAMQQRLGGDCWGQTPGGPSRLAATLAEDLLSTTFDATPNGLRVLERTVTERERRNVVRWIPPTVFQALCDLVGVVIHGHFERQVDWAECAPEDGGFAPPPLFRIHGPGTATGSVEATGDPQHIAIGLHVLRWCVMPLLEDEADVPLLADWLDDEFGGGASGSVPPTKPN